MSKEAQGSLVPERYRADMPSDANHESPIRYAQQKSRMLAADTMADTSSNTRTIIAMLTDILSSHKALENRLSRMEVTLNSIVKPSAVVVTDGDEEGQPEYDQVEDELAEKSSEVAFANEAPSAEFYSRRIEYSNLGVRSMSMEPKEEYGGMSEKDYMDRYFKDRYDLFAHLLVSMCASIQTEVEHDHGRVFSSSMKGSYNAIKRAMSVVSKHSSFTGIFPDRKSNSVRTVAKALGIRAESRYATVNGNTFLGMAISNNTDDVFRCFQNILVSLKKFHEWFPAPSGQIIRDIGTSVCKKDGSFDIDTPSIGAISSLDSFPRLGDLKLSQVRAYITSRLDGRSSDEAYRSAVHVSDTSVSGNSGPPWHDRASAGCLQASSTATGRTGSRLIMRKVT